jgi:hypothetical protein
MGSAECEQAEQQYVRRVDHPVVDERNETHEAEAAFGQLGQRRQANGGALLFAKARRWGTNAPRGSEGKRPGPGTQVVRLPSWRWGPSRKPTPRRYEDPCMGALPARWACGPLARTDTVASPASRFHPRLVGRVA